VIAGVAWFTVSVTVAIAVVKSVVSVGVNVTFNVWGPAPSTIPDAGE
jgi:hypothetical protein